MLSRVADPGGEDPDPIFKKKKKMSLDQEKKSRIRIRFESGSLKNRIGIKIVCDRSECSD